MGVSVRDQQAIGADKAGWLVVLTKQQRELQALMQLKNQKYETYMPRWFWHGKGNALLAAPLFPGYLFVQNDPRTPWQPIRSTIGVRDLFRFGEAPVILRNGMVEAIQQRETVMLAKLGQARRKASDFAEGDKVVVLCGDQFAELDAVFVEPLDANRVSVLVMLLGRETKQTVDLARIKPRPGAVAVKTH